MNTTYEKNLNSLKTVNLELYNKISKIQENERFEVFQGSDMEDINILDTQENIKFYNEVLEENRVGLKKFENFSEYDYLYIYGIGNGFIVKNLLKNIKHQQIVIIEPHIELLYIVLNLENFTKDLNNNRLVLMLESQLTFSTASNLFLYKTADLYARVFKLNIIVPYYEHLYSKNIIEINKILLKALEYVIYVAGNSTVDQALGLKQHLQNIPYMLKGPKFTSLKNRKNSDTAIIVSTGPSLHKQLKLLKKIEKNVTIISVDASLPILEKHSIKPDIVTSMERDEISDVFYKKTSKSFQKNINFVCASLQNKKVFEAIKEGRPTLVMRPFHYNAFFEMDDYGYICSGMSSANMAYEIAVYMGYRNVIFIGQDLAYGKDGSSHSKNHILGEDFIKNGKMKTSSPVNYENIELEAYGGEGIVKSIYPWKLFLNGLVYSIEKAAPIVTTINSTEGGARIDGTLEIKFKNAIKDFVDTKSFKKPIVLKNTPKKVFKKYKKQCDIKVQELINEGMILQEKIEKVFIFISEALTRIENKNEAQIIKEFNFNEMITMLDKINNLRETLSSNKIFKDFYYDMLKSVIVSYELELSEIKIRKVTSKKQNELKAIQWINGHRTWMFDLAGGIWNVLEVLKNDYVMEP